MNWNDRIRGTTTDNGTGTLTISGTVLNHLLPSSRVASGGLVPYFIGHQTRGEWEVGLGTVAANVLTRSKLIDSSTGSFVDFTTGKKNVFLTVPGPFIDGATRYRKPVRFIADVNRASMAPGTSHGGVTVAAGDRGLLINQTTPSQNGIYEVVAGGALTRAVDMWAGDSAAGAMVVCTSGDYAGLTYVCTNAAGSDVVGTNSLTFAPVGPSLPVPIAQGGTGATTAAGARSALGVTETGLDTTYCYRANNLSDLADAATARSNLGVTATGSDTTYAYRSNNLSDLTNAATARTNLGLGTIATQAANNVTITGGSISGITDLAVADGGTGASTAANARTNLGAAASGAATASGLTMATSRLLGRTTASTGAIEEISVGSNLTLSTGILSTTSNVSASLTSTDNGIVLWSGTSGQILKQATGSGLIKATSGVYGTATAGTDYYAPGGTDVAVADGGTGASSASAAATNLGLGTGDNVTHLTVTVAEAGSGSGNGGLVATTVTAGGNAGIRLASGGTNRFQFGCIGSAGSTACRFYVYEDSAEGMRLDRNRNLCIGTTVAPTGGASCLVFGVAGTVLTPTSAQAGFYAETITSTTEMRAVDGAGNRITLTPHPPEVMETHRSRVKAAGLEPLATTWGYRASNDFTGIETVADLGAALLSIEYLMKQAGRPIKLVWERPLADGPAQTWEGRQQAAESKYQTQADAFDAQLRRYVAQPFWERGRAVSMPVLGSDKPAAADMPKWLAETVANLGV